MWALIGRPCSCYIHVPYIEQRRLAGLRCCEKTILVDIFTRVEVTYAVVAVAVVVGTAAVEGTAVVVVVEGTAAVGVASAAPKV